MFLEIKSRVESELKHFLSDLDKTYHLSKISPLLYSSIKDFASREGKRIRPTLFVIGYLGYAKKPAHNLYRSATALELLHAFMLVHDDIIDKSLTRRGKPSMHAVFNKTFEKNKKIKFNGEDLAIVAGDVMYAMALHAFLSVEENMRHKEAALKKLIEAVLYTGSGEFIELVLGLKQIAKITKNDIYKIYDLKTANYTFATPLTMGALLAGANKNEVKKLYAYGIYLGRAFQIQDDILGTFSESKDIGKSNLTDMQEAKKTILIWYAYNNSNRKDKTAIENILDSKNVNRAGLLKMRRIINDSGALNFALAQIKRLIEKARVINKKLKIKETYRVSLDKFSHRMLSL